MIKSPNKSKRSKNILPDIMQYFKVKFLLIKNKFGLGLFFFEEF